MLPKLPMLSLARSVGVLQQTPPHPALLMVPACFLLLLVWPKDREHHLGAC